MRKIKISKTTIKWCTQNYVFFITYLLVLLNFDLKKNRVKFGLRNES